MERQREVLLPNLGGLLQTKALIAALADYHSIVALPDQPDGDVHPAFLRARCNVSTTDGGLKFLSDTSHHGLIFVITMFVMQRVCPLVRQLLQLGLPEAILYPASVLSDEQAKGQAWRAMEPYHSNPANLVGHPGAQAIFVSNFRLWYRLLESEQAPHVTILEEDVVLAPHFMLAHHRLIREVPDGSWLIKWSCPVATRRVASCPSYDESSRPPPFPAQNVSLTPLSPTPLKLPWSGVQGYSISRKAARVFIDGFGRGVKGDFHFDHFLGVLVAHHPNITAFRATPSVVFHGRLPSARAAEDARQDTEAAEATIRQNVTARGPFNGTERERMHTHLTFTGHSNVSSKDYSRDAGCTTCGAPNKAP